MERNQDKPMFGPAWIVIYAVFFVVGVVMCCYGYAATQSNLLISGEATLLPTVNFGIEYMQEMTTTICDTAKPGTADRLIDSRDGKVYWVEKMKDGKCWMTQNLAYDITAENIANNAINSNNTDLRYSSTAKYQEIDGVYYWNSASAYPPTPTHMLTSGQAITKAANSRSTTYSWNFGEFVNITPLSTTKCGAITNLAYCSASFKKVDASYKPTLSYASTKQTYSSTSKTYDAHFLVGNYYQFNTITAGSAEGRTSAHVTSSLCPKGWQLPMNNNATARSWASLLEAEGFNGVLVTTTINNKQYNVSGNPIYAIRLGAVLPGSASINDAQNRGYIWTSYAATAGQAAFLRLYEDKFYPAYNNYRYYGLPARCVAI